MVNCEQAPTAEPCDVCEQCVAIREGTHVDVVEIDAASHGGVDDARDLREKAPTARCSVARRSTSSTRRSGSPAKRSTRC